MKIGIVTLFPTMLTALNYGITGRAQETGLITLMTRNPRDFTSDRHGTVDDRPYGGGPGMVMMVTPLCDALLSLKTEMGNAKTVYLSPQGRPLTQAKLQALSHAQSLILIAGRYEGIDERFIESYVDEECSIGDYVLSGGELAAMVIIDGITRLLPGALGHVDSAAEDSFMQGLLDCPHYTRPETIDGKSVPSVLLSGDHRAIARWRQKQALGRTAVRRPDLLQQLTLTTEQQQLLTEFRTETENKDD